VRLTAGESVAVLVEIEMTDAAGVYQVDSLLKSKLKGSGLEAHTRIVAVNTRQGEKQLVERFEL
jgi:metal-dependent HD superfamily phosphatase/phosphodiesterase